MGDHPDQRPLELADVFLHLVRDEREHVLRHQPRVGTNFGLQDGDPRFKVGRLNIGDQAPRKAGTQPVLQGGDLFRWPVGRDHDLAVELVQGIEGMEKFFLGPIFAGQELDIVDQ